MKVKSKVFVKAAVELKGNPYCWAGNGETLADILRSYATKNGQSKSATDDMITYLNRLLDTPLDKIHFQDCSGLIVELLRKLGVVSDTFDDNAEGLYHRCTKITKPQRGALCFYYQNGRHNHVGICVDKNTVVHALSTKTGVIVEALSVRADKWKEYGLLDEFIQY